MTLEARAAAPLVIRDSCRCLPSTLIAAEIGDDKQFGKGGFTARANHLRSSIHIGYGGRYRGGITILGRTRLESGSQVLDRFAVDSRTLGNMHMDPDPDRRGTVLKGHGLARDVRLGK